MEVDMINIFNSNKKISVKVVSLLDKSKFLNDKEKFFDSLLKDIKEDGEKNHVGGFLNKNLLKNQLEREIFDKRIIKVSTDAYKNIKIKDVKSLIKEVVGRVKTFLNSKKILVYVFPTSSNFIIKKMGGSSGFLVWKNIIHVYLYPTKDWKTSFRSTLLHELAHCMQPYYSYKMNVFEHLIAEGLAEHFQIAFIKKRNPWTRSISKKDAIKIFRGLINSMNKSMDKDYSLHAALFFGNKKYPLWSGYTIGFYLAEDILKGKKKINWKEILRKNPSVFKNQLKNWFY